MKQCSYPVKHCFTEQDLAIFIENCSVFEHVHEHLNSMLESSFIVSFTYRQWPTCRYHLHERFTKVTSGPCQFTV